MKLMVTRSPSEVQQIDLMDSYHFDNPSYSLKSDKPSFAHIAQLDRQLNVGQIFFPHLRAMTNVTIYRPIIKGEIMVNHVNTY